MPRNRRHRASLAATLAAVVTVASAALTIGPAQGSVEPSTPPTASAISPAYVPAQVLVRFKRGTSTSAAAIVLRAAGAHTVKTLSALGVRVVSVPAGREAVTVSTLRHNRSVEFAERDATVASADVTPNDPYWPKEWSLTKIGAPAAWGTTTGDAGVTVAVLDSGLNATLPEFAGRVVAGYNFVAGNSDTTDDNSHGTAAAGVALAEGNNGYDVAGVCWKCRVMPVKVLDAAGSGTTSGLASGITWAVDHGARVISMSLAGASNTSTVSSAVAYAVAHGVVLVAAAGNSGCDCKAYPAANAGVIAVAATDANDALTSYSDFGSWVALAAPGANYSTWPSGNVYQFSGTSSATPVVAGAAALVLSTNPGMTPSDVATLLERTATPLAPGAVAYGRVNVASAVAAAAGQLAVTPSASASPTVSASATPPPPTATPAPSASTTTSPVASPSSPTPASAATVTIAGTIQPGGSKSTSLSGSVGTVTATVQSASSAITVRLYDGAGALVTSATGGSGTTLAGVVPAGAFTIVVIAAKKSRFQVTVTFAS
jgi:subtilisin family serine protease